MKILAVLMVVIGVAMGWGSVNEFLHYGPGDSPFWVGVFGTLAAILFVGAGLLLWFRGHSIRRMVLVAAFMMATVTIIGTALGVMGILATLLGMIGSLAAIGWFLRTTAVTV